MIWVDHDDAALFMSFIFGGFFILVAGFISFIAGLLQLARARQWLTLQSGFAYFIASIISAILHIPFYILISAGFDFLFEYEDRLKLKDFVFWGWLILTVSLWFLQGIFLNKIRKSILQ